MTRDTETERLLREAIEKGAWDDRLFETTEQRANLLLLNDTFQKLVLRTRKAASIPNAGFADSKSSKEWRKEILPGIRKQWDDQITEILGRARLMAGWRRAIQSYVTMNRLMPPPTILIHDTPDEYGVPQLQVTFNDLSTKKDLDFLQSYILAWREFYGYNVRRKQQPFKKMEYYLRIRAMKREGMTDNEIAQLLETETLENENAPAYTSKLIRDDLRLFQKLIDKQMN